MARSLVASDTFTRANGDIGANWSYIREASWEPEPPQITSNVVTPLSDGDHYQVVRWNGAGTFNNNQYAKLTIGGLTWQDASYRVGVVVRCSADTDPNEDFYAFWVQDDEATNRTSKLVKRVNGTETALDTRASAWTNGDTIALEVEGTTLRAYKNDVLMFSTTDSSLTTGKPGLAVGGNANIPTADNWEGGDIVADGATHNLTASNCTQANTSSSGTITVESTGILTTPPLKNNTGTLLANETGATAYVYNVTTGALVLTKTSQTTNSSGVMTIEDAALVPTTQYRVVVVLASGAEGMDKLTAA